MASLSGDAPESQHLFHHDVGPRSEHDGDRARAFGWSRKLVTEALRWVAGQPTGVHILLVLAPLSYIAAALSWYPVLVSALNFLAIIPFSALVSDASDQLAVPWGPLIGGLLNATFGNAVELIVSLASRPKLVSPTVEP